MIYLVALLTFNYNYIESSCLVWLLGYLDLLLKISQPIMDLVKITILLLGIFIHESSGLWCFDCSTIGVNNRECPTSLDKIKAWKDNHQKFGNTTSSKHSCAIGFDQSKVVHYQAILSNSDCQDQAYLTRIKVKINQHSTTKNADIICCVKDGCNWNYTTAYNNMTFAEILASESGNSSQDLIAAGVSDGGYIALVVVLVLLLLIACCICCLLGFKKKKEDEEDYSNDNITQISSNYNLHPFTNREEEIPVTPVKNINNIKVERTDHERYSAIDKKIYRRDQEFLPKGVSDYKYQEDNDSGLSSAYSGADAVTAFSKNRIGKVSKSVFDTEDFHKANNSVTPEDQLRGGAKNWSNVWKSATSDPTYRTKPAQNSSNTNVNPFRFDISP